VIEFLRDIIELLEEQRKKLEEITPNELRMFCYSHLISYFNDKL
jgi:hypothetical protein